MLSSELLFWSLLWGEVSYNEANEDAQYFAELSAGLQSCPQQTF